jgi:hypothetical protein
MSNIPASLKRLLTSVILLTLCSPVALASSKIISGIIIKVNGDRIVIRAEYTPYSSVSSAKKMMTRFYGAFHPNTENLDDFMTYYIDEIPVTKDQMVAALQPGMRVSMMENRKKNIFCMSAPGRWATNWEC